MKSGPRMKMPVTSLVSSKHFLVSLALLNILIPINEGVQDVTRRVISGNSGEQVRVKLTPTADPVGTLRGDAFVYQFSNLGLNISVTGHYVKLEFFTLHLPKDRAVLKIYDGADANSPLTVFTGDFRPFVHSSGPDLYMMLKIYDVKDKHTPPEFDVLVKFTEERSWSWEGGRHLTSTALCKEVHYSKGGGSSGAYARGTRNVDYGYKHDCRWRVQSDKEITLVLGWNVYKYFGEDYYVTNTSRFQEMPSDPVSLEPQLIRRKTKPILLMVYKGTDFYIWLSTNLYEDFSFGYHADFDTAVDLMKEELERESSVMCPFKTCWFRPKGDCKTFYRACNDRFDGTGLDNSCDKYLSPLMDAVCGTQCYNSQWDGCDDVIDCGQPQNETCVPAKQEDDGGTSISTPIIIGVVLFLLCVIIIIALCFWCRGRKCQRSFSPSCQNCRNRCTDSCNCNNCCYCWIVCCNIRPQQLPSTGQPVVTSDLDASPVVYMSRSPDNTFIPIEGGSTTQQPGSGTSVTAPMLGRSIAPPPYPDGGQPLGQGNTSSTEAPPPYSSASR